MTLVLMLSCNKKVENNEVNTSKKEYLESSKNTLSRTNVNLDSISKESSQKELEASSDTISVVTNDVQEINKQLNGVWYPINMGVNGQPDDIMKGYIYMFDAKKNTIDVYDTEDYWENFNYKIITTDCDNNKKNPNTFYLKLNGDGDYCSKIIAIKKINNKIYLILESQIANRVMTEFLKISDDPKFFPKGFK